MSWTLAWIVFLLVGAVAVIAAKRLDDAERREHVDASPPEPDQT